MEKARPNDALSITIFAFLRPVFFVRFLFRLP